MKEETPGATPPPALLIGVRLIPSGDAGELFADAKAVEAAGADSLWIDGVDGDPYVVLAALAAVTWRVRLVARGAPTTRGARTCARLRAAALVAGNWRSAGQTRRSREPRSVDERGQRHRRGGDRRSCCPTTRLIDMPANPGLRSAGGTT